MAEKINMPEAAVIKVGERLDDFSLKDQSGREFRLSEQAGKRVLLSFHPLAWTSICAEQMKSLEANKKIFDSLNAVAVGISVDSVPCKKAWAEHLGIVNTSLLSDFWPHGAVAALLGLFSDKDGIDERSNVLVNEDGRAAFVRVYERKQLPPIDEVIGAIKKLS